MLGPDDHPRDSAGMTYVYPVVSRRAGGVSVGINLNTNNACNWRCIYCQVPGLRRGAPPPLNLALLRRELDGFLDELLEGDFLLRRVPEGARRIVDVALSGNGEPTASSSFCEVVEWVAATLAARGLAGTVKLRVISNGSLIARREVQDGLRALARAGGELWFKLDAASAEGFRRINDVNREPAQAERDLTSCAALCDTWVQTCLFRLDGAPPAEAEIAAYCALLARVGVARLKGVLLYGIARPSLQPEARRLSPLAPADLDAVAGRLREMGLTVQVSP